MIKGRRREIESGRSTDANVLQDWVCPTDANVGETLVAAAALQPTLVVSLMNSSVLGTKASKTLKMRPDP